MRHFNTKSEFERRISVCRPVCTEIRISVSTVFGKFGANHPLRRLTGKTFCVKEKFILEVWVFEVESSWGFSVR